MAEWEDWGKENLRDGDIIFRLGDARACCGLVPFSKLTAAITKSRYSHTGIVAVENDELVIYDMTPNGARRIRFRDYLSDRVVCFAVKRPNSELTDCAAGAVDYCRKVYDRQVDFDRDFLLDDRRLYCTELTEKSYRATGLPLSEPVRVGDLPCYGDFPVLTFLMKIFSPFRPGHQLIIPGNDEIGIYSCDKLELVLDPTSPLSPPPQQLAAPLARSADALSWTERTH